MSKNILVVDDSALMRRVISDIIKQISDYEVLDLAFNGLEGFDRLVSNPGYYDLVILDINMPRMNGLELLKELQKYKISAKVMMASTDTREGAKREPIRVEKTVGRNDPCPCGSGKKFKNCHGKNI